MADKASTLVMFGATGDLARRMLLPSLYGLDHDKLLDDDLRIIGTARSKLSQDEYRETARAAVREQVPADFYDEEVAERFLRRLDYTPLDITDESAFGTLAKKVGDPGKGVAIFLSTAPSLFEPAIQGLRAAGLACPTTRLALEKPLGTDLQSSRVINDAVAAAFPEIQTFRIDHYLGKETVQNLLALRFANSLFEPLWNSAHIDHVQITVAETVGLEGRNYYDATGALRDMVQNHMLQLLALVAMEPPIEFDSTEIRSEKVKVLRSLRPMSPKTVADEVVFGQFGSGAVEGQPVASYADELGSASQTATFAAIKAHVDNWRWAGVPFYLRTGKRMPVRRTEILIQFKCVPHSIFASRGARLKANKLLISIQPQENIRLIVMGKTPGLDRDGIRLREVPLDVGLANAFADHRRRIAYERLLLDLIDGDPTLFVRRDEVEAQWTWIDGLCRAAAEAELQPLSYTAGSWGPSAAVALTERDGVHWND
jgi:glucose-6-phosphate 1-dehydrogenase